MGPERPNYFLQVVSCCPLLPRGETQAGVSIATESLCDTYSVMPPELGIFTTEPPFQKANTCRGAREARHPALHPRTLRQGAAMPADAHPPLCPAPSPEHPPGHAGQTCG